MQHHTPTPFKAPICNQAITYLKHHLHPYKNKAPICNQAITYHKHHLHPYKSTQLDMLAATYRHKLCKIAMHLSASPPLSRIQTRRRTRKRTCSPLNHSGQAVLHGSNSAAVFDALRQ